MRLLNEVTVAAPPDELFTLLRDVERVAPCLPGASIAGRDGDDYAGRMKVRVGPLHATYEGQLRLLEVDSDARRTVMQARGDDLSGGGNAEARIVTSVEPAGNGSVVRMDTDLQVRGRMARFGRGAIETVSARLFETLAENVARSFEAPPERIDGGGGDGVAAPAEGVEGSLDALDLIGRPLLVRLAPVAGAGALGFAYGYLLGRLRGVERRR